MKNIQLELRIPKFEELAYRRKLLADSETMSYNVGYGNNEKTGCIDFDESDWIAWYSRWINKIPERYYAYIISIDEDIPVGEVALRYVKEKNAYCVNIIIEAKHRGKGFSQEALRLLMDIAFEELKAKNVYDEFPQSRKSAVKVFNNIGFKRVSDTIVELTKQDYLYKKVLQK